MTTEPENGQPSLDTTRGRLAEKVAIVTGAGAAPSGIAIGTATAIVLAAAGAKVCVADLDWGRAEATREIIARDGHEAIVVAGDTTNELDCVRIVDETVSRFGTLDVLVNNVGLGGGKGTLEDLDLAVWQRVVDVNLKSPLLMSRASIAQLLESRGAIVNVASVSALGAGSGTAYGPSKAAVVHLTSELATIYGRRGVRVNAVAPGHVYTPSVAATLTDELRALRRDIGPLGIEGNAWDIALAILFLASEEARFITGACLPVDGGATSPTPYSAAQMLSGSISRTRPTGATGR